MTHLLDIISLGASIENVINSETRNNCLPSVMQVLKLFDTGIWKKVTLHVPMNWRVEANGEYFEHLLWISELITYRHLLINLQCLINISLLSSEIKIDLLIFRIEEIDPQNICELLLNALHIGNSFINTWELRSDCSRKFIFLDVPKLMILLKCAIKHHVWKWEGDFYIF